jgi:hypothetical protein
VSTALGCKAKEAANKSYIKEHSTSYGSLSSTASHKFVPANQSGKTKKNKSRHYKRKPQKPNGSHGSEGLLSLMQGMLRRMDNMDKTSKLSPGVK